jgi:hypothetical protein
MKTTKIFRLLTGKAIVRSKSGILILLVGMILAWNNSVAQNAANLIINPANTITQVGQTFNVSVRVDFTGTPSNADAVEIHLAFDKTKLQVNSITKPSSGILTQEFTPLQTIPNINTAGQIDYNAYTLSGPFLTSDADILTITFQVLAGTGTSTPLTLLRTLPANNSDIGSGGVSIITSAISGSAAITSGSCSLGGATISNTSTCNGQPFNLVLQSITGSGTSPYSLVVNGTTYNNVNVGASFATITPPTNNFFNGTPASVPHQEDNPLELGMIFQSNVAGFIKGVRFFSDDDVDPAAVYTGSLRLADGTLLASAVFSGPVTSDTWTQVLFSAPVDIAANTDYIVTYHSTRFNHSEETGGAAAPITNGPLTTAASGGVFRYSNAFDPSAAGFGTSDNNYWADVLFTAANFSFNFTSITDAGACAITGSPLQQLNVVSPNCNLLPVTLMRLSATSDKKDITVSWSTAAEIDNDGFEIQRSSNGRVWEGITYVKGKGNSTTVSNYSFVDKGLFPQTYYYRLKQVDIDTKYKFSAIVTASINGKAETVLGQNYPNPFRGETLIPYTLARKSKVNLTVFDLNGRAMQVLVNGSQDAGSHNQYFYPNQLPAGVYYYRLTTDEGNSVKKLIVR